MHIEFFGETPLSDVVRFQEHKCLQLKVILQQFILHAFNSVQMPSK